jgi:negative regulator of flagellin synthesis FlgM
MAAMNEMPDIDQEKVAALKTALERGELPFNPAKLAALIERYHRSGR